MGEGQRRALLTAVILSTGLAALASGCGAPFTSDGSTGTTVYAPGVGNIDVSAGKAIVVAAGQRVVKDVELTSSIYKMEKFTVAGEREGTAKAETLQRLAPNVKNIVSSQPKELVQFSVC